MGNVVINGVSKKIFFSAANYYGANLKVDVLDDDNGVFIVNDVPMVELIEPIVAFSTTTSAIALAGEKILTLTSLGDLVNSDRITVNSEVYRIIDIDTVNSTVTLHRPVDLDVASGLTVDRVGNMGIFKINLFITQEGYYVIQAKDTKFGLQKSDSVTIKGMSLEDMFSVTNGEINANERIIRETSSFTIII